MSYWRCGIGAGSVAAGYTSGVTIEHRLAPPGAAGISVISALLAFADWRPNAVICRLSIMGIAGGFFIVPVSATLQHGPEPSKKGEVCVRFSDGNPGTAAKKKNRAWRTTRGKKDSSERKPIGCEAVFTRLPSRWPSAPTFPKRTVTFRGTRPGILQRNFPGKLKIFPQTPASPTGTMGC